MKKGTKIVRTAKQISGVELLEVRKLLGLRPGQRLNRCPTSVSWTEMKQRCLNSNTINYKYYGARGITIDSRWIESFARFVYDIGKRPGVEYTLERIDNEKGYYKSNCKWLLKKLQSRHRRVNIFLMYKGEKKLLIDWAQDWGINGNTIRLRYSAYGWPIHEVINGRKQRRRTEAEKHADKQRAEQRRKKK